MFYVEGVENHGKSIIYQRVGAKHAVSSLPRQASLRLIPRRSMEDAVVIHLFFNTLRILIDLHSKLCYNAFHSRRVASQIQQGLLVSA